MPPRLRKGVFFVDKIRVEREVDSTNDAAIEAAREGAAHGWAVRASVQTAGRGRRGHRWASAQGGLYLSVVLRPQVSMHQFVALPAVVAMAVVDVLRDAGLGDRVGIKWPNDIVARTDGQSSSFGRKLAGILVEAKAGADGPFAVAGVGINVCAVAQDAPELVRAEGEGALPLVPVSLEELLRSKGERPAVEALGTGETGPANDAGANPVSAEPGDLLDLAALAERLRDAIVARVDAWAACARTPQGAAGPLAPILSEYFDMVPLLGHEVAVVSPAGHVMDCGVFAGLDVWGRAVVMTPAGEQTYPSEAVSLREV